MECWLGNTDLVTLLLSGPSKFRLLAGAVNFAPVQNVQTASEAHSASCSVGARVLPRV